MLAETVKSFRLSRKDSSSKRLIKILDENKDKITVNDDGIVSTDFQSKEVKKEINRQLKLLEKIKMRE